MERKYLVKSPGGINEVVITEFGNDGSFKAELNGKSYSGQFTEFGSDGSYTLEVENKVHTLFIEREGDNFKVYVESRRIDVEVIPHTPAANRRFEFSDQSPKWILKSPMAGRVIEIFVSENQVVEKEQDLMILHAMKMENRLMAARKGLVRKIHIK